MEKIKYCGNPKVFARKVAEQFNLKASVDIFGLAEKIGLTVYWIDKLEDDKGNKAWGKLYFDEATKENRVILSKEIAYLNSKRFTLAHEIAHFLIDGKETTDIAWRIKFMYEPSEEKYNIFAINLLIPDEKEFKQLRQEKTKSQLANYYGVPITSIEIYERDNGYGC